MDEVSIVIPSGSNLSSRDWFRGAIEDDAVLSLSLDASQSGLFNGNFVPPPPRPLFLDDGATSDGLTTCDLCTWAWQNEKSSKIDKTLEAPAELGWVLTLVIVSITSAVVGAIIMIIVLHCKSRLKNTNSNETHHQATTHSPNTRLPSSRPPINIPDDKTATIIQSNFSSNQSNIWSWLSRRPATASSQLDNPQSVPAENHYTHMEDTYNSVGEALYAELDRESTLQRDSPAYQNSAYTDPDAPTSSAPSSAYYSDLSVTTTAPDRVYEVVGLSTMPIWDSSNNGNMAELRRQSLVRLAAISENVNVPSDYV